MGKHDPRFVEARLCEDGVVVVVDDDGEVFYIQMRKGEAWPEVSRRLRRFESNEAVKHGRAPTPRSLRLVK